MKVWLRGLLVALSLSASGWVHAQSAWSAADYDLYPGDFNGDGLTDLLYISKDPARPSGIVLSDGVGLNTPLQTWGNAYLGIPWNDGAYNIVVADFDGDGKADLLLQRKTPGDSYLLLTEDGGVGAISQTIPYNEAGLTWSADQHQIIAGDFNGDGRADLFFQPTDTKGLSAIILSDQYGQFTAKAPSQSWNDGYTGLNWATAEVQVFAGDFDGDGRSDLLVQAYPMSGTGPGTSVPAQFQPNSNGVLLAQAGKQLFNLVGLQAWSRDGFGADWSPLDSVAVVGDFNADGRSDVFLQGATANNPSYLLYGHAPGTIFAKSVTVKADPSTSAAVYRLMAGQFTHDKGSGLYYQSLSSKQTNFMARLNGGALAITQADASLAASTNPLASATRSAPSALAAMAVTSAGRTPGQFAVSAMGAATYQIPIWTPPGARGIEPKLAMVYASGSPDGMMGPGWNLSGLSSITRCNKTYADDGGAPAAVTLTTSDDYCLDGNRLRVTSGTYGASGSVYQTEIANFSRVTANGTAGNGPSYFIVESKDGLIYEYGNTADSKVYASGGSTPYSWMLNKVRDRQTQADNLTIVYSTTSGSVQPATISYTQTPSTNGTTYPYTVSFTYQNRTLTLSKYIASQNVQLTQILSKIDVKSSGTSVRQYNLTYSTAPATQRDRLSSIQECGGSLGTDCLRPTTVTYQDGAAGVATTGVSISTAANFTYTDRDFNGDGRPDIAYFSGSTWYVALSSATGYGAPINTGITDPSVMPDHMLGGKQDGFLANQGGTWWYYSWNGTTFAGVSTGTAVDASSQNIVADTDGDGLPDLVTLRIDGYLYVRLNNGSGSSVSFAAAVQAFNTGFSSTSPNVELQSTLALTSTRRLDFNGDGRQDILYWTEVDNKQATIDKEHLLISNGTTFSQSKVYGGNVVLYGFADFNGDGCTDAILQGTVDTSKCNGTDSLTLTYGAGTDVPVGIMDWNGDGLPDIVINNAGHLGIYLSRTIGFSALTTSTIPNPVSFQVFDVNGDGLQDIVYGGGSGLMAYTHNGANTPPDLATTISDGWGISATATYTPITQNNYSKYSDAAFPEMDIQAPMYVVSTATQADGLGGTFSNTFWYYGARMNLQGRGFEGFYATRSQDLRNSLIQYTYYNRSYPYTGTVFQRDSVQPNDSTLIARTTNAFNVVDLGGVGCAVTTTSVLSRCFPYLQEAITKSYEITTGSPLVETSDSTFTYDSYGNPLTASTTTTDNDSSSPNYNDVWTSLTTNTFGSVSTATWCLDKPTRTTTQNSVTGQSPAQPTLTRTVDHAVDTTYCRFTSETAEPTSSTLKAVTNFGYDTCGNVNSVGIVGLDQNGVTMPTRTTTSNYGTRCTFPESVTNALSQTAYAAYNYSYGTRASSTDPNNVAVSWLYDNFGRKTRENRPDATYSTWGYSDCTADPCWGVSYLRFEMVENHYDSAGAYINRLDNFYDGFERSRFNEGDRVLGTWTVNVVTYNSLGLKQVVYLPQSSSNNGYHYLQYDLLNRPTSDSLYNASGGFDRSTGMAYAGLKTTLTDARGNSTTKWTDVAGKLRRIIDPAPGGTTNYTYDAFGNLAQIVDAKTPTGATTSYSYNIRGFKTDSVDPDTGHWVYKPDSLNELVTQTDAKSQVTSFGYDLLGRMISRTEPESTTASTWAYGTSPALHEIGRLKSVSKPDGYAESYTYDGLGRPAGTTITEDTNYTIGYAYNSLGAVDTVTYPASTGSPFVLKYLYSYGAVQQVKDNAAGTVFWTLSSANDSSLPMTEVLGNGVNVSSTYTPWTNELITRKEGTGGVSNSLQDLVYLWDLNGNLQQRKDQKQLPNLTEIFVHDALNRISSSTLNGTTNLTVGYDEAGNITSKSDVGSYDYTTAQGACNYTGLSAQPHAVRKAGAAVYCYDANGNATSRQGGALTWTSYNLPSSIAFGSNATTFNYNANHQRWKQDANYAGVHETTYYIGGLMEKVTKGSGPTEYRHLIPAGSGSAILTRRSDLTNSTYYTTSDHLGSGDFVLDSTATVLVHESFTPFGARRGSNWQGIPTTADYTAFSNTTRRGFTGHEMLDSVGLIHMNGRVYDPTIGRFLSADPIIQTIALSQAINPFSYVMNMPLTLTDPSGLSWLSKLFSGIGNFFKKWGQTILSVVLTYLAGPFISALIIGAIYGGNFQSFAIGFAVGMIAGAIAGPLGGNFAKAIGLGGKTFAATVLRGAIVGGLAGGISSVAMGGTFGAGFAGGAIGGALSAGLSWKPSEDAHPAQPNEGSEKSDLGDDEKTRPDLAKIASDADIKAAIEKARLASGMDSEGYKKEYGFWITRDPATGKLSVEWFRSYPDDSFKGMMQVPLDHPADIVAFFHVHPTCLWACGPSGVEGGELADWGFSKISGVPGIILSHFGLRYFGPPIPTTPISASPTWGTPGPHQF